MVHQHGRRVISMEHQYGFRDVMWKQTIVKYEIAFYNLDSAIKKSKRQKIPTLNSFIFNQSVLISCLLVLQVSALRYSIMRELLCFSRSSTKTEYDK